MNEIVEKLRVPKERINVIIGVKGVAKRKIQKKTNTKLKIEDENTITIAGEDGLNVWNAKNIIKAIARGFSPEKAILIDGENYIFEIIEINDFARNENDVKRLKGRVIGRQGKSRDFIEKTTGAYISVYGKTVAIISPVNIADTVRKAITMLLEGAMHKTVFNFIEKKKMEQKRENIKNLI